MKCELCKDREKEHLVDSDMGLWPTKIPMCEDCFEKYQNGAELQVNVEKHE